MSYPKPPKRVRPNEPLREEPALPPAWYETRPKPLGFCLPTPAMPPTVRDENMVGRDAGEKLLPPETGRSGAPGMGRAKAGRDEANPE
jgi:hypothetical protein